MCRHIYRVGRDDGSFASNISCHERHKSSSGDKRNANVFGASKYGKELIVDGDSISSPLATQGKGGLLSVWGKKKKKFLILMSHVMISYMCCS